MLLACHRNSANRPQFVSRWRKISFPIRRLLFPFAEWDSCSVRLCPRAFRCWRRRAGIYFWPPGDEAMEFFDFDKEYFRRLQDRDSRTENHFVTYFGDLLQIKLRSRLSSKQAIEDIQQETFARVLAAIRSEAGIREPERLGAFVNSVCNNVLLEFYRASSRNPEERENAPELADPAIDLDGFLASKETCAAVRSVLQRMPEKDRLLLRAVFLEEKDKDQVCRELGVERDYLRVLLHRAKQSFRLLYEKENPLARQASARGLE